MEAITEGTNSPKLARSGTRPPPPRLFPCLCLWLSVTTFPSLLPLTLPPVHSCTRSFQKNIKKGKLKKQTTFLFSLCLLLTSALPNQLSTSFSPSVQLFRRITQAVCVCVCVQRESRFSDTLSKPGSLTITTPLSAAMEGAPQTPNVSISSSI